MEECWACKHRDNWSDPKEGHAYAYGGSEPCRTKNCRCKEHLYGCSYPRCPVQAEKQYRDQYTKDDDPYLCKTHEELKDFIGDCVRGALKNL